MGIPIQTFLEQIVSRRRATELLAKGIIVGMAGVVGYGLLERNQSSYTLEDQVFYNSPKLVVEKFLRGYTIKDGEREIAEILEDRVKTNIKWEIYTKSGEQLAYVSEETQSEDLSFIVYDSDNTRLGEIKEIKPLENDDKDPFIDILDSSGKNVAGIYHKRTDQDSGIVPIYSTYSQIRDATNEFIGDINGEISLGNEKYTLTLEADLDRRLVVSALMCAAMIYKKQMIMTNVL